MERTNLLEGKTGSESREKVLFFCQVSRAHLKQCYERIRARVKPWGSLIALAILTPFIIIALAMGKFPFYIAALVFIGLIWPVSVFFRFTTWTEVKELAKKGYAIWITSERVVACQGDDLIRETLESPEFQKLPIILDMRITTFTIQQDFVQRWSKTIAVYFYLTNQPARYMLYYQTLRYIDECKFAQLWSSLRELCVHNTVDSQTGEILQISAEKEASKIFLVKQGKSWETVSGWFIPSPERVPTLLKEISSVMEKEKLMPAATGELQILIHEVPQNTAQQEVKKNRWTRWLMRREARAKHAAEQRKLRIESYNKAVPVPVDREIIEKALSGETPVWTGMPHPFMLRSFMRQEIIGFLILATTVTITLVTWRHVPSYLLPIAFTIVVLLCPITVGVGADFVSKSKFRHIYYTLTPTKLHVFRKQKTHTIPLESIIHFQVVPDRLGTRDFSRTAMGHVTVSVDLRGRRNTKLVYVDNVWTFRNLLYKLLPPKN